MSVSSKILNKKLSKYITGKHISKKFTKEVFSLSQEEILHLLGGYFDGDGSFSQAEGKLIANNYSKDMADQLWWMLIRSGIRASLNKYPLYGDHYPTDSEWCYRLFIPASDILKLAPYMRSGKVPVDFVPPFERELKFFYEEDGVRYFCQPIKEIRKFLYTGEGYDMEILPEHSYILSGFKVSNCNFWYENEPKVASAIDFYSQFPINGFKNECRDLKIKKYFDDLCRKLDLDNWMRVISNELYRLGDCFPFIEIECEKCGGSGVDGSSGEICNHKGGTWKRVVVLNPEFVEVYTDPITPDPGIALIPDDELKALVMRGGPGADKLGDHIKQYIVSGRPIPLDNRNVSHLKMGDRAGVRYGTSIIRRLFPYLAYKTKLMTAQWIVAERMILPIKIVKVGSETRPAGPQDIANVQAQLAQTAQDPNLTLVTHHDFELEWYGAAGKVLQLTTECELIDKEILDGLMLNKALLNGEGPTYSNAAIGVEVMIQKLDRLRKRLARWVEEKIYLPVAMMRGFTRENEWGETEYVYPKLRWNPMHMRDQQQHRQFMVQLYEKGVISTKSLLDVFEIDYDNEVEMIRWEKAHNVLGQPGGEMGGGFGGGGAGGLPGMPGGEAGGGLLGGDAGGMEGGALGGPGGGDMGGGMPGGGAGSPPPVMASQSVANIAEYGGRVLKPKTRDRIVKQREMSQRRMMNNSKSPDGWQRDASGRIIMTGPERQLLEQLVRSKNSGFIKESIHPQFPVKHGSKLYTIDFAMPRIKLGIEVDGGIFHSTDEQIARDKQRDANLSSLGWTILRFTDDEIESKTRAVVDRITSVMLSKEKAIEKAKENTTNK